MFKMIFFILSVCACVLVDSACAQDMWTWMGGAKTGCQTGVYGKKGLPDAANAPGARFNSVSWFDSSGNLWLFGGSKVSNDHRLTQRSDLWRYSPETGMWTWMSGAEKYNQLGSYGTRGTPHTDNVPGARSDSISWIDKSGNLWLFGGYGRSSDDHKDRMNDLWRYNPRTKMWTWMSGSKFGYQSGVYGTKGAPDAANMPGARGDSISWIDGSGNLWLFGGYGRSSKDRTVRLNDLWRYSPSTKMWRWMSGSKVGNKSGVYGIKNLPDAANVPGARSDSVSWTDSSGNLWLFGGYGYSSDDHLVRLNDLWRYSLSTKMWTWMSGSKIGNQFGAYGTKGLSDAANVPGSRSGSISWVDKSGNLWLFGGQGCSSDDRFDRMNDLWSYSPDTNEWAWMSGSKVGSQLGVYGTKGVGGNANVPGGRANSISWTDDSGKLWLFGGYGQSSDDRFDRLNDLWRYELPE